MEDDLIKNGTLKLGKIDESTMINSPEKLRKIPINILKTLLSVALVIAIVIALWLLWFYIGMSFCTGCA